MERLYTLSYHSITDILCAFIETYKILEIEN